MVRPKVSGLAGALAIMKPGPLADPLRSLFHSESHYHQAEQWWADFWAKIPGSSPWQSPWLNTRFADGSLMHDGDGILSAKHPEAGRAFKIMQEEDDAVRGQITWWKQTWDPDDENLTMLVIVIVPSTESLAVASELLRAWAKGDEVPDDGDERWIDGERPA
jgi:hypothetical protein